MTKTTLRTTTLFKNNMGCEEILPSSLNISVIETISKLQTRTFQNVTDKCTLKRKIDLSVKRASRSLK